MFIDTRPIKNGGLKKRGYQEISDTASAFLTMRFIYNFFVIVTEVESRKSSVMDLTYFGLYLLYEKVSHKIKSKQTPLSLNV